jgi:hypothetical protein
MDIFVNLMAQSEIKKQRFFKQKVDLFQKAVK